MNVNIPPEALLYAIPLAVWTFFWKGIALWKAIKGNQRNWFVALIILFPFNLMGIVEITYLFFFAKEKFTVQDLKFWEKKK